MEYLDELDLSTPQRLQEELQLLLDSGAVADLVKRTICDPALLGQVAQSSYAHANGFDKLVMAQGRDNRWKLRAHVWPAETDGEPLENVHNHRWDFASYSIAGELQADYFDVAVEPDGDLELYEYFSPETADSYAFRLVTKAMTRARDSQRIAPPYAYALHHEEFHRVRPVCGPALTVVLQGPVKKPSTTVLRTPGSEPVITDVNRMTSSHSTMHLETISELLKKMSH